jgi:hypothetical protein
MAATFRVRCLAAFVAACGLHAICCPVVAQVNRPAPGAEQPAPAGPPIKSGRIVESTVKGKQTTLTIEDAEGKSYEVRLTPQIDFAVLAPGDPSFVKKGLYVMARGIESEGKIFLTKLTLHVAPRTKRMPPGRVQAVAAAEGESLKTYDVSGELVSVAPAEGYPEYTAITLKIPGRIPPIWLEPSHQVEVASANPEHATVGADVQMAMRVLPGNREIPTALRVRREAAFTAEELFGAAAD